MFRFTQPMLLDGAAATNMFEAEIPANICIESYITENPEKLLSLQKQYVEAGSEILIAPTFAANRIALSKFSLGDKVGELCDKLCRLTIKAADGKAAVAGDISPVRLAVEPFSEHTFDELLEVYREQAKALEDAGADLLFCETFTNLADARAALLACKETSLPVAVCFSVNEGGSLPGNSDILAALATVGAMGADAVGINCSAGPQSVINALDGIAAHIPVPIIAMPNTGATGTLSPDEFAKFIPALMEKGAGIIGGCCGTTPEHIKKIAPIVKGSACTHLFCDDDFQKEGVRDFIVANEKQTFLVSEEDLDFSHKIKCDTDLCDKLIELEGGNIAARVVVGSVADAHEFGMNAYLANVPVVFLGFDEKSLDEALKLYQGRAMIDSKSELSAPILEKLSKRYGAVII